MVKQKDPELISSHKHTQITTICTTTMAEKNNGNYQQKSSTTKGIRKEP